MKLYWKVRRRFLLELHERFAEGMRQFVSDAVEDLNKNRDGIEAAWVLDTCAELLKLHTTLRREVENAVRSGVPDDAGR